MIMKLMNILVCRRKLLLLMRLMNWFCSSKLIGCAVGLFAPSWIVSVTLRLSYHSWTVSIPRIRHDRHH
jgi:hypothetical protein